MTFLKYEEYPTLSRQGAVFYKSVSLRYVCLADSPVIWEALNKSPKEFVVGSIYEEAVLGKPHFSLESAVQQAENDVVGEVVKNSRKTITWTPEGTHNWTAKIGGLIQLKLSTIDGVNWGALANGSVVFQREASLEEAKLIAVKAAWVMLLETMSEIGL